MKTSFYLLDKLLLGLLGLLGLVVFVGKEVRIVVVTKPIIQGEDFCRGC